MIAEINGLLRAEGRYAVGAERVPAARLLLLLVGCCFLYGAVMGARDARAAQALFSGLKVPLLLVAATLVCLPNFYVVNTVLGLRSDFASALRAVLAAQATMAVMLAALAPVTLVAYQTSANYRWAVFVNGVLFAVATLFGQESLGRHYRPLIRRNRRHLIGRFAWVALYIFVAIQLAWVLRPFIGDPSMPTRFFREEAWSNAYVVVFRDVLGFGGR